MSNIIEQFLYREARLADENLYTQWFELWAEDGVYWMPSNTDELDTDTHISVIFDTYSRIRDRVNRLNSGTVLAQVPAPRMRRLISNIEVLGQDGDVVEVGANFIIGLVRFGKPQFWCGRYLYRLRVNGEAIEMVQKKVLLIDNDEPIPLVQFLI